MFHVEEGVNKDLNFTLTSLDPSYIITRPILISPEAQFYSSSNSQKTKWSVIVKSLEEKVREREREREMHTFFFIPAFPFFLLLLLLPPLPPPILLLLLQLLLLTG